MMNVEPNMDSLVRTIGDPTRIRMLTILMGGARFNRQRTCLRRADRT